MSDEAEALNETDKDTIQVLIHGGFPPDVAEAEVLWLKSHQWADTFDGLTLCPFCATRLAPVEQSADGVWSARCQPCDVLWRWDDEGYWEGE